jgi:ABC-type transport system involved in cytochrome bd biosynthesis fused ATPase/permease subunit
MLVDLRTERGGGVVPGAAQGGMRMSVEAQSLEHRHAGHPSAVGPVDFRIAPGERVAWLAALGSGSSTLLELLAGLRRPTAGHVLVDGIDVDDWNLASLHQRVMLLREGDVVSGTIADNLRLGAPEVTASGMQSALEATGLASVVRELPDGLQTSLVTGGLPLTSRQRVRLLVARALVARPGLLLLDEVLDGLDPVTFERLLAVVLDPAHEWTVLVATRDARVAQRFARVVEPSTAPMGGGK